MKFEHPALTLSGTRPLIYPAFSKHLFYFRMAISKFVLERGGVPLNPFMLFDYFLLDTLPRDDVRDANNSIVRRVDEVWIFGPISNGVLAEIRLAKSKEKPLRFYEIQNSRAIVPLQKLLLEEEVAPFEEEILLLLDSSICK